MLDLTRIVSQTFKTECKFKHSIKKEQENVVEVDFSKFSIILYYNPIEYDLGINYCKKNSNTCLLDFDNVLSKLGCQKKQLPPYKFMSNEEIMVNYLKEYIFLLNNNYEELENYIPVC